MELIFIPSSSKDSYFLSPSTVSQFLEDELKSSLKHCKTCNCSVKSCDIGVQTSLANQGSAQCSKNITDIDVKLTTELMDSLLTNNHHKLCKHSQLENLRKNSIKQNDSKQSRVEPEKVPKLSNCVNKKLIESIKVNIKVAIIIINFNLYSFINLEPKIKQAKCSSSSNMCNENTR